MPATTAIIKRIITIDTANGMTIYIHVMYESPVRAEGRIVVRGPDHFNGEATWETMFKPPIGTVCEISRGMFTMTQRHALAQLIKNTLTIELINF